MPIKLVLIAANAVKTSFSVNSHYMQGDRKWKTDLFYESQT